MGVKIIIDSACDMTKAEAEQEGLLFLPLKTIFGQEEYLDGVTISHREFYEKLKTSPVMPTTSQVAPAEFAEAYQEAVQDGSKAVVITISEKLSGTYQSAMIALEGYEDRVFVVDSENGSFGEQILVRLAIRLREQGMTAEEMVGELEKARKDICIIALLDTLEYLKRGGRISGMDAFAGALLDIKPVIALENGEVISLGKARGSKKGNNLLNEMVSRKGGIDFERPYCLGYSGLSDELLQKYIRDSEYLWKDHTDNLPIGTLGSTIGTHAGPGAVVVAFFHK